MNSKRSAFRSYYYRVCY